MKFHEIIETKMKLKPFSFKPTKTRYLYVLKIL